MPFLDQICIKFIKFDTLRLKMIKSLLEFNLEVSIAKPKLNSDFEVKNACVYCRDSESLEVVQFDTIALITSTDSKFQIMSKREPSGEVSKYLIIDNFEIK